MEKIKTISEIDIAQIKNDICWIKKDLINIKENHLTEIYKKLDNIEEKFNSRPSWSTFFIITTMATILTAFIIERLIK